MLRPSLAMPGTIAMGLCPAPDPNALTNQDKANNKPFYHIIVS